MVQAQAQVQVQALALVPVVVLVVWTAPVASRQLWMILPRWMRVASQRTT